MLVSLTLEEHRVLSDSPEREAARLEFDVEQIYEQTRAAICSYLLSLGVPEEQAPEVTQEVYLRLYQTMSKGEQILNLRAWVFRVAHNLGLKVRSREKALRAISPDWNQFADYSPHSPERTILDREKMQRVQAALETLSPQQRNCLFLRSEGLRYREIAEVMGISLSTVNEFLRRAISRLAEALHA
ncbi:MAG: sigma-70 family RNA polymerase sigma factor [Bryobacteraceae bacterium]